MRIIGITPVEFAGKEGKMIEGISFFVSYPLSKGEGEGAEKFFLSKARLALLSCKLKVGTEIEPTFNRFCKIIAVKEVSDTIDLG